MHRLFTVILILLLASSGFSETLRLGRSSGENSSSLSIMNELGRYLITELNGKHYNSFEILTDRNYDNDRFISVVNNRKVDMVIESLYSSSVYTDKTDLEPAMLISKAGSVYRHSLVVVRKDSGITGLKDLGGKIIALTSEVDAASFTLPLIAVKEAGFKIRAVNSISVNLPKDTVGYYLTKDKYQVANNVYLKKVDAGAVCSSEWGESDFIPEFVKKSLNIAYKSKSVPGLYLLIRKSMPDDAKESIVEILSSVHLRRRGRNFLKNFNLNSFHRVEFNWKAYFRQVREESKDIS